jgi:quinol monooxygenase YgiN
MRHPVNDFSRWKKVYEEFEPTRKEMGVKAHGVYQALDDSNDVTVWHDFEDIERARSFVEAPRLKEAMSEAGVAGVPTTWFTRSA